MRGAKGVSAATSEQIFKAAQEIGYRPDTRARLLRSRRSRLLGVQFGLPHPFHADLVESLTAALFADQQRLADATQAARTVDARSAILTQPVPLHDGALRWFSKDAMA